MDEEIISLDQLLASPWKEVLEGSERETCSAYRSNFIKKINIIGETSKHTKPLLLISSICSMHLATDEDDGEPFGPEMVIDNRRSFMPQDFTDAQADILFDFLDHIDSNELKARIADTIWVSKKGKKENLYPSAKTAIAEYISSGKTLLDDEHPIRGVERLERAVSLAVSLGRGGSDSLKEAIKACKDGLRKLGKQNINACQFRLIRTLFERQNGGRYELGCLCFDLSEEKEARKENWDLTRSYWGLTAEIFKKARHEGLTATAKKRLAWNYLKQVTNSKSFLQKAFFLAEAIEAFRRIGEQRSKIDLLHKWLLRVESRTSEEMRTIQSDPVDLTNIVNEAQKRVSGKPFREALVAFGLLARPTDPEVLREQTIENAQKFVFSSLFGAQYHDKSGKVVAKSSPLGLGGETLDEDALLHSMHTDFRYNFHSQAFGMIEPARRQLLREHRLTAEEIYPLLLNNPIIPQGRTVILARGLAAGFNGDFLVAEHLLIPQIEQILRHIVSERGGIPSKITNGIQQERPLGDLLADKLVIDTLGKAMVFSLQTVLIEQTGENRRHDLCHGLLDDSEFDTATSIYIWWIVFRLCFLPMISRWLKEQSTQFDS